jgi:hypothetical protein
LCAAFDGTLNSMVCPHGYSQVTTEAACESLAAIGGKSYAGNVTVATFPPGCFWLNVGGGVYLNTHATGAAHPNAQQLCVRGAPATPSHAQPRAPDARQRTHAHSSLHTHTRPAIAHVGTLALRRCGSVW